MNKEAMGRLILEASTGMHGDVAKQLSDAWVESAQEANDLLTALLAVDSDIDTSGNIAPNVRQLVDTTLSGIARARTLTPPAK